MEKNIVILGGGFGGLTVALNLNKKIKKEKDYKIHLIDRKNFHTYTPLLYKIVVLDPKNQKCKDVFQMVNIEYDKILDKNINFIQAEIIDINLKEKKIYFKKNEEISNLNFEYLVLALGSEINDFKIPYLKKYALFLKKFEDAIKIREIIFKKLNQEKKKIKIFIGGAGPTGVELALELQKLSNQFDIFLIEKNDEILKNSLKSTKKIVLKELKKEKIQIFTSEIIKKINKNYIFLESKNFFNYDIFIFTGGVKIPNLVEKIPFKFENNRIKVNENLLCEINQEILNKNPEIKNKIFALGDLIYYYDPKQKISNPQSARAAIKQGKIVSENIYLKIKNKELKQYKLKKYNYIIPLGNKKAVIETKFFAISGFLIWLFKWLIELIYLSSITNFKTAFKIWFNSFKVLIKNN